MGTKKNDSEKNFIKDESMLTEGQKKRLKKVNNRIKTNNDELEKWREVLQAEQAQDMKKVAIHTAEVVEAIGARGDYLQQKKGFIIEQINEEHKGGSSSAAMSLAGEPDEGEDEYLDVIADEKAQQNGEHLDQTESFVWYKDKKKRLVKADGSKINLGAGEKIVLDDNTFDEVVDFITAMNEKFPELGLKPENISFSEDDTMNTLKKLNEHFGVETDSETKMEDEKKEDDSKDGIGEDEEESEDKGGVAVRFVGVILDDEQQLLISGIGRDNFDEMLESDRFEELFPDDKYEIILDDEDGADLVIKSKSKQVEAEAEDSDEDNMSLDDALKLDESEEN